MNYKNSITTKIPQGNDFTLRVELTEYIKLKGKISERKVTFKDETTPTVNIYYQNGRIIKNQFNVSFEEGNHTLLISFIEQGGTNVLATGKYAIEIKGKRNEDNSDFRWYLPIGKAFNIVYSSLDGYFPSDSITTYSINGVVGMAQSINSGGGIFQQVQVDWTQGDSTAIDYIKNKPNLASYITLDSLKTSLSNKQDKLISGTNIKTINSQSLLITGENDSTDITITGNSNAQVQSNWTEPNSTSPAYIRNKPTIPTVESLTPTIQNGYWYIGTEPTNVKATGEDGDDGNSAYIHIKYSDDKGTTFSQSQASGGSYLGIYTDDDRTASDIPTAYTWSKIKGEDGIGISSIDIKYLQNSDGSTTPSASDSNWSSTMPLPITSGNYLWTKIVITTTASSNNTFTAYSVARQGIDGQNGSGGGSSSAMTISQPPNDGNAQPNILYNLGTLNSPKTITLGGALSSTTVAEYLFRFKTGTTSGHIVNFAIPSGSNIEILYPYDYILNLDTEYEVSILWDGTKLLVRNCAYQSNT